ncbi:hypothetical protein OQA88_8374 [Cercophora sp. LCS_1]
MAPYTYEKPRYGPFKLTKDQETLTFCLSLFLGIPYVSFAALSAAAAYAGLLESWAPAKNDFLVAALSLLGCIITGLLWPVVLVFAAIFYILDYFCCTKGKSCCGVSCGEKDCCGCKSTKDPKNQSASEAAPRVVNNQPAAGDEMELPSYPEAVRGKPRAEV